MPQLVRDGLTEEEFLELKDAEDGGRDMIQSAVTNTNPVSIHFSKLNYSIEVLRVFLSDKEIYCSLSSCGAVSL